MGKAFRWFRGLIGLRSTHNHSSKKKWSFTKSRKDDKDRHQEEEDQHGNVDDDDASKRAIAVAAATAAVAEAAVFAAQAAAAVVHLTSSGRIISATHRNREDRAAITIQSHFRAYLSRRALRALKALVRLQALVRGHLVRKQTAYILRRLQALVRAQVRARAGRANISESPQSSMKSSVLSYPGPATPEISEHINRARARSMKQEQLEILKRQGSKSRSNNHSERSWEHSSSSRPLTADDYQFDKVLEVDNGKPRVHSKSRSFFQHSTLSHSSEKNCPTFSTSKNSTARQSVQSPCHEVQSFSRPLNYPREAIESAYCTADNSPTFYSASSMGSSKRGAFTPTSSDCSRSCLSGYSDHPNYMAYTESSKAKVRSSSAPKLRPQYDRSSSAKRYSIHTLGESRFTQRGSSSMHANFTIKAYPGSGRLDRLGIPT